MPITHIVKEGDSLIRIAKMYNFTDYNLILDAPDNRAFVEKRPNPNTIMPGDTIIIPDKIEKEIKAATGQKHTYVGKKAKAKLKLILQNSKGEPYADKPYKVEIEAFDFIIEDQTDGDGLLEQTVPADADSAKVSLQAYDDPEILEVWDVSLGGLNPVDEITGVQQRLTNLGIDCGTVDGINGPKTQAGIKLFQAYHELEIDGKVGDKTQSELVTPPLVILPEGEVESEFKEYDFITKELEETNFKTVAIKLIDKDGNGIPGQPFTLKHSRRKILKGKTNTFGEATIEGISSDNALIRFKNYDYLAFVDTEDFFPELDIELNTEDTVEIVGVLEFNFSI